MLFWLYPFLFYHHAINPISRCLRTMMLDIGEKKNGLILFMGIQKMILLILFIVIIWYSIIISGYGWRCVNINIVYI